MHSFELGTLLTNRQARIAVLGMGYVGLPLALMFSEKGYAVVGYDIDRQKIETLSRGESYIREIPGERIQSALNRQFLPTFDPDDLKGCHAFIICVPTPLQEDHTPHMDFVIDTCRTLASALEPGVLVSLESTVYPGATRTVVKDTLELSGRKAGIDFHLIHSPERIDPGSGYPLSEVPKLVAGLTPGCCELGARLYGLIFSSTVPLSTLEVAETAKLHENIYRAVNIALVNELRQICHGLGIDCWEVIDAAATKPYGFNPFYPGPGVGGHCIPLDPSYLAWRAHQSGIPARFIELAVSVNEAVPGELADFISARLLANGKDIKGSRILVLGVAYKRDVDDMRESPAIDLIEILVQRGGQVSYHDPFIPHIAGLRQTHLSLSSVALDESLLNGQDIVVITTDHNCLDYEWIAKSVKLLIDARGITRHRGIALPNVILF